MELANKIIRQLKPDLSQMGEQEPPLNLGLLHVPPFVSPLIRNALNKSGSAAFNVFVASLPFVDTVLAWWAAAGQIYCQAPLSLQLLKINILRRWRLWLGLCFGLTCKVWDLFWGIQIALEIFGKTSQCLNIKEFHLRIWSSSDGSFGTASTAWTWQCLPYCCVFQGFGHPDEMLAPFKKSLSRLNLVTLIDWLVISLLGYLPCILMALVLDCLAVAVILIPEEPLDSRCFTESGKWGSWRQKLAVEGPSSPSPGSRRFKSK